MKEQDITKMEFLLTLNDRIIVQRFFNVRGFNPSAKNSTELYEFIKEFKEDLESELKQRSVVYMLDNIEEIMEDATILDTSMTNDAEMFNMYVKVEDMTICHRQFNAKPYPPKVRYTVDVRPYLKDVLRGLTDIFSAKNLSYDYLGLPLMI